MGFFPRGQSSWNGRPISGIFGKFERPAGARIILIRLDNPPLLSRVKEALQRRAKLLEKLADVAVFAAFAGDVTLLPKYSA